MKIIAINRSAIECSLEKYATGRMEAPFVVPYENLAKPLCRDAYAMRVIAKIERLLGTPGF